jgi:hypothetical protein
MWFLLHRQRWNGKSENVTLSTPGTRPAPYRDDFVVTEHQGDHSFHADMTDWYLLTNDDMQEEQIRHNNGSSKARIFSGEKRNGN